MTENPFAVSPIKLMSGQPAADQNYLQRHSSRPLFNGAVRLACAPRFPVIPFAELLPADRASVSVSVEGNRTVAGGPANYLFRYNGLGYFSGEYVGVPVSIRGDAGKQVERRQIHWADTDSQMMLRSNLDPCQVFGAKSFDPSAIAAAVSGALATNTSIGGAADGVAAQLPSMERILWFASATVALLAGDTGCTAWLRWRLPCRSSAGETIPSDGPPAKSPNAVRVWTESQSEAIACNASSRFLDDLTTSLDISGREVDILGHLAVRQPVTLTVWCCPPERNASARVREIEALLSTGLALHGPDTGTAMARFRRASNF